MGRGGTLGALNVHIDKDEYSYTADLVDGPSYGGFSGSPCISTMSYVIWNSEAAGLPPGVVPRDANGAPLRLGNVASIGRFCGMFSAHFDDKNPEGAVSRYGVGVMLPSDYIRGAPMSDQAREEHRVADEADLATRAAAMPPLESAGAVESGPSDEWGRFEDLTRNLVHVPSRS